MSVISQTSLLRYGNRATQSIISYNNQIRTGQKAGRSANGQKQDLSAFERQQMRAKERALAESNNAVRQVAADGKVIYQGTTSKSALANSRSYAQGLSAARSSAKETALKLKKLRYDFKGISTEIMRSKTSASARQVVSKAKREVMRLKRLSKNGDYDEEELQAAISHAKAMERVAKKKVRHLLEEEMGKVGGKCLGDIEEKEEDSLKTDEELEEEEATGGETEQALENADAPGEETFYESGAGGYDFSETLEAFREEFSALMESMSDMTATMAETSVGDMMSDMMEDLWDSMSEMMEDLGLEELNDDLMAAGGDMDPADLKMMKIKHRCKEMKEIAEADGEYLKAVFDHLQKQREAASSAASKAMSAVSTGGSGMPGPALSGGGSPAPVVIHSAHHSGGSAPTPTPTPGSSGGFSGGMADAGASFAPSGGEAPSGGFDVSV